MKYVRKQKSKNNAFQMTTTKKKNIKMNYPQAQTFNK